MLSHVSLGTNDAARAAAFYDPVLATLGIRKLTFLRELPKVFKGTHVDSEHVMFLRGEEIEVASDRPFVIYADGDPIGATPAIIRVERRVLRVIAPPD